jgi:MipA family protein
VKTSHVFYVSLLALIMPVGASYAKEEANFSTGLIYISSGTVYSNAGSKSRVMPSLSYERENISVGFREGISYKILNGSASSFTISVTPKFKPYDSSDSVDLSGLKRNMYFDGSASASYTINRGLTAKFKYSMELMNEFNGNSANLSLSQFIPVAGIPVIVRAGSKWYDSNRSEYLYGVYSAETTSLRPRYAPGNVFVPYLDLNTFYKITESISVFANISANFLPAVVKNSPIVIDKNAISFILGLGYKF